RFARHQRRGRECVAMQLTNNSQSIVTLVGVVQRLLAIAAVCGVVEAIAASTPNVPARVATIEGGIWAILDHTVRYGMADDRPEISINVAALGYGAPRLLAADPYDHSAWIITTDNLLTHFDTRGQLQAGYTLPDVATALAVALDQTAWI